MTDNPRQSVKARRRLKQGDEQASSSIASKYTMAIKQQREMMRPALSPSSANSGAFSEADMDQILSPTFSSGMGQPSMLSEANSADSIIRRVEQEIAAARKIASGYNSPAHKNDDKKEEDEDDADMANILNTNTSAENNNDAQPLALRTSSSSDSSKDRAMHMIRDEFQADLKKEEEEERNNLSAASQRSLPKPQTPTATTRTSDLVYSKEVHFSDEEWQTKPNRLTAPTSPAASASTPAEEKQVDSPGRQQQGKIVVSAANFTRTSPRWQVREDQNKNDVDVAPMDEAKADKQLVDPQLASSSNRHHRAPAPAVRSFSREDAPVRYTTPSGSSRDPEGNYAASTRSPPNNSRGSTTENGNNKPSPARPGMTRTRELLENLKEQRESIASRSVASPKAPSSKPLSPNTPTLQRAAQFSFTRATRAKEKMRSSPRNRKEGSPESAVGSAASSPVKAAAAAAAAAENAASSPGKRVTIQPTTVSEDKESISPRRTAREVAESLSRQSSKIRFRNPFPVLKPPLVRRDPEAIIQDHSMGLPEMPVRWVRPKKELRQLIVAAMGTSLPRRSNACGALKVLTKNKKNQMTLVRTDGFLGALIFAASQAISEADRDLAIDARTRAVCCLKNVCDPKDNRVIVFSHPGVVECLVKVIKSDTGEGRAMAAAAIALLAKTPGCREGLAHSEELVEVMAKVLQGAGSLVKEEEELSAPLCPSPKFAHSRKMDDSVSAFSEHSHSSGDDRFDDDRTEDEDLEDDDRSASSLSSVDEPPAEVVSPREIKHVDSIRNQTEERRNEFVALSRSNACAALLHLSKQCAISV